MVIEVCVNSFESGLKWTNLEHLSQLTRYWRSFLPPASEGGNHDNLAKQQRKMAVAKKSRHQKQNFSQNAPIDPRTIFTISNIFFVSILGVKKMFYLIEFPKWSQDLNNMPW